jgi:mitochondrial enoyl-[acyl-carrier protein] reductase / trans-2-enoyl-CoA reductase
MGGARTSPKPDWLGHGVEEVLNRVVFPLGSQDSDQHPAGVEVSLALTYSRFGAPAEVLALEERPLPAVGADEVRLKLLAATINPSDYGMILGKYGTRKELPAVAGREGVAEVVETGMGVANVRVGDRVVFPAGAGTWQSAAVVPAEGLRLVSPEVPVEFAAMMTVNPPTAWRILRDANLPAGSWVAQNAANSAVGLFVLQMARHLGLRTLNIVRNERWIGPLTEAGADVVVLEESGYERKLEQVIGRSGVQLAINSVGGESALRLINCLSPGGTHVTIGAMSFEATRFPTRQLIFSDVNLRGFWMDRWYRTNSEARAGIMFDNLVKLVKEGVVSAPVSGRYPLTRFSEALAANGESRLGKVLLVAD